MKPTKAEYQKMTQKASPPSPKGKNCAWAFMVGGLLCAIGEAECQLLTRTGMELQTARTLISCSLILLSAVLTVAQVFDNIAKHAGAGTLVPITGFANAMSSPVMEYRVEGMVLGIGPKIFSVAGSVIAYGVVASSVYGLIYYILFRIGVV